MYKKFALLVIFTYVVFSKVCLAQDAHSLVSSYLLEHRVELDLSVNDATHWAITSSHTDDQGVTYCYIRQENGGIPVHGAVANFAMKAGEVVVFGDRLERNVPDRVNGAVPAVSALEALQKAAVQLGMEATGATVVRTVSSRELVLRDPGLSRQEIPTRLIYQPTETGAIVLAWDLTIRSATSRNWWHVAIDANTGALVRTNDYTLTCTHAPGSFNHGYNALHDLVVPTPSPAPMPPDGSSYNVFPFPIESPSFGAQAFVMDPADPLASPNGWHDTNGIPGAEYTITRGNNVYAGEDIDDDDEIGYSPDGGSNLQFTDGYLPNLDALDNMDASITNLFFTCNVIHDVLYLYGFDEQAGNFQAYNVNGGLGDDEVIAQDLDGGGTNNANFGTPPDGDNGYMQMYVWRSAGDSTLTINTPANLAGVYQDVLAGFGPILPTAALNADIVLVQDNFDPFSDGCELILNANALNGKIALVDRGTCSFVEKVLAAQDAGALAVIVVNNSPDAPTSMGGSGGGDIVIPSVMISMADGDAFKLALETGTVNATLQSDGSEKWRDSGLDNGVITHEYGHGVSNRSTGGPSDTDCLDNDEQMGEGWSDWLALMFTTQPGDVGTQGRGMATFLRGQETEGNGIRPARYSTDFAINDYTYGDTNDETLSQPHGIGFVWATMLWDLNWALVNVEGYDPDLYNGTSGNNVAMHLVLDGMKLQECSPGFIDGRDAILLADQIRYEGAHECLIWNVFAYRGLGASADQGSSFDRFDQVEAFDVSSNCLSVGVSETNAHHAPAFTLKPNPTNIQVVLELNGVSRAQATLVIHTTDGRVMDQTNLQQGVRRTVLDVSGYAAGVYLVEVNIDGTRLLERLVVGD